VAALPDSVRGKAVQTVCPKCGQAIAVKAGPAAPPPPSPVRAGPAAGAPPSPVKARPQRATPPANHKKKSAAPPPPVRAKPQPAKPPARARKAPVEYDDDPPQRRRAPEKSSGKALLGLLIGGLCGGVVLAACAVALFLYFSRPGPGKAVAQAPRNGTDQQVREEGPPKREAPVETAREDKKGPDDPKQPPPEVKGPSEEPPPKPDPDPRKPPVEDPPAPKPDPGPRKPPVEEPPAPPPKIARVSKTRDGAMTLVVHPEKNLRFTAVSPDGKLLYTAAWDNQLRVWDAETFDPKDEFPLPKPDPQPNSRLQAALSPDGKSLVFAHWDFLQIMDLKTKKADVFEGMPREEHGLGQIVLSRDGRVALTRWATVNYAVWRVADRKFIAKLSYDGMGLARGNASVLAPDGSYWINAPGHANGVVARSLPDLRDLGAWSGLERLTAFEAATDYIPSAPALSPKGKLLAYAQHRKGDKGAGVIRVFDLARRTLARELPLKKYSKEVLDPEVNAIAISPDDKLLVAIDSHRWVHGYDLAKGTFLGAFAFPRPGAWSNGGDDERTVLFTADGRRLIAGALNLVKVWDRDNLAWPDPLDPANQPEQMADKGPAKPPDKAPPKEPDENEYKDAKLKVWNELDYYFEVGGQIIRAQAREDTAWLDVDGKKVGTTTARFAVLRNKGNTVRVKTKRVAGQRYPALVEMQATRLVAEYEVVDGSAELKGARVSKFQKPHVWLTGADGKEHHAVVIYSTVAKDREGKDLEKDDRFKIFKVGNTVDAVVGPSIEKVGHSNLLFARLVKE
jgi:WD40 repeat protein